MGVHIGTVCPGLPHGTVVALSNHIFDPNETMAIAYSVVVILLVVVVVKEALAQLVTRVVPKCMRKTVQEALDKNLKKCLESTCPAGDSKEVGDAIDSTMARAAQAKKTSDAAILRTRIVVCWLEFPLFMAAVAHFYTNVVPKGQGWHCTLFFWASAPLAKDIAVPLWVILMPTGQFAHWLLNRHETPIRQTGIPAGKPPLPMNGFTFYLMVLAAFFSLAWLATSAPVVVLLGAFPLNTLLQLVVFPVAVVVLLPMALVPLKKKLGMKSKGVDQKYTLKIAAAQGFCTVLQAAAALPLYDGVDYWDLTLDFFDVSWPEFVFKLPTSINWPDLPFGFSVAFGLSIALAVLNAVLFAVVPPLVKCFTSPEELTTVLNPVTFGEVGSALEEVTGPHSGDGDDEKEEEEEEEKTTDSTLAKLTTKLCKYGKMDAWGQDRYFQLEEVVLTYHEDHPQEGDGLEEITETDTTGRMKLKTGQLSHMAALVLVRVTMAGASVLSGVQALLVKFRNRKPRKDRQSFWSMEQADWFERNFDHVVDATVKQFAIDNKKAKQLYVPACTNLTVEAVQSIAFNWKGVDLNIALCNITGGRR